jgi:hypothetical protein
MTDEPKDGEMSHMEFLRAEFFSSDADHAAYVAEMDAKRAAREAKQRQRRARREAMAGVRALAKFARAMDARDQAERRANIGWLADKYLGIRL